MARRRGLYRGERPNACRATYLAPDGGGGRPDRLPGRHDGFALLPPTPDPPATSFDLDEFITEHNRNAEAVESLESKAEINAAMRPVARLYRSVSTVTWPSNGPETSSSNCSGPGSAQGRPRLECRRILVLGGQRRKGPEVDLLVQLSRPGLEQPPDHLPAGLDHRGHGPEADHASGRGDCAGPPWSRVRDHAANFPAARERGEHYSREMIVAI